MWIWIDTSYFVGGFDLNEKFIVGTSPPIARWAVGKHIDQVLDYYRRKMKLNKWVLFKDGREVKCGQEEKAEAREES